MLSNCLCLLHVIDHLFTYIFIRCLLLHVVMYPHMYMYIIVLVPCSLACCSGLPRIPAVCDSALLSRGSGGMLSPGLVLLFRVSEVDSDAI